MNYIKKEHAIYADNVMIFDGVSENIKLIRDKTKTGIFLQVASEKKCQFWSTPLGIIQKIDKFSACYRKQETFWMFPCTGKSIKEIPPDTQWLLVHRSDNLYVVIIPIIDGKLRFSLDGKRGEICLWADTGDPWTIQNSGTGAFIAVGKDLYALQKESAIAIVKHLKTIKLRCDKPVPDFIDFFGWCTWNAFYRDVSEDKILSGLESFKNDGVLPGFIILDDGWLSFKQMPVGGDRLVSFCPNEKFPSGFKILVKKIKKEFGVKFFLAWHAIMGYWAGLDGESFPDYDVKEIARYDPSIYGRDMAELLSWMGLICGIIPEEKVMKFYDDFHCFLSRQGIDGVKVDNQSSLELSTGGLGSRVCMSMAYRKAIEASCNKYFSGRLINCMSGSNDMILMSEHSNLWRTSTDFWPDLPETHTLHLYTNSLVGLFFGYLIHPDWDMFKSNHPWGQYHAAGRAISGSLVYISDKPGTQNVNVLKKLVCSDGTILRCKDIGRVSPGCVFHNPTRENVLLKIFNFNEYNAVLGVFHARYKGRPISDIISLKDIPGLDSDRYVVFSHQTRNLFIMTPETAKKIVLKQGEWEIFTFAPVHKGISIIGLSDKYNSGGAIKHLVYGNRCANFYIKDAGVLVLYAEYMLTSIRINGRTVDFNYTGKNKKVIAQIPSAGKITIKW